MLSKRKKALEGERGLLVFANVGKSEGSEKDRNKAVLGRFMELKKREKFNTGELSMEDYRNVSEEPRKGSRTWLREGILKRGKSSRGKRNF